MQRTGQVKTLSLCVTPCSRTAELMPVTSFKVQQGTLKQTAMLCIHVGFLPFGSSVTKRLTERICLLSVFT